MKFMYEKAAKVNERIMELQICLITWIDRHVQLTSSCFNYILNEIISSLYFLYSEFITLIIQLVLIYTISSLFYNKNHINCFILAS